MEKEEINSFVKLLKSKNKGENPELGIYYIDHENESYITGNKAGLQFFAVKLLEASSRIDEIKNGDIETLYININEKWIHNEISLNFVEPVAEFRPKTNVKPTNSRWNDLVFKFGCFAIVGIILISCVVGIITLIGWMN